MYLWYVTQPEVGNAMPCLLVINAWIVGGGEGVGGADGWKAQVKHLFPFSYMDLPRAVTWYQ